MAIQKSVTRRQECEQFCTADIMFDVVFFMRKTHSYFLVLRISLAFAMAYVTTNNYTGAIVSIQRRI